MTAFEYAVLALVMFFSVTNACKLCTSTRLNELPVGYLLVVFGAAALVGVSIVNLAYHLIGGS